MLPAGVHQSEHPLAITAYHAAFAPCYSSTQQSRRFHIALFRVASGKLHRVGSDKLRRVYARRLTVEQLPQIVFRKKVIHNYKSYKITDYFRDVLGRTSRNTCAERAGR